MECIRNRKLIKVIYKMNSRYLFLRFENAAIILPRFRTNPKDHWIPRIGKVPFKFPNKEKPIGINQLSNALHVMLGLAPVPSNRPSVFKRCEVIYEMAKNSFIKYDDVIDEDAVRVTKFLDTSLYSGNGLPMKYRMGNKFRGKGCILTWNYFERAFFESRSLFDKIINLFNEISQVKDVKREFSFIEYTEEFQKHLKDERVINFLEKNAKNFLTTVSLGNIDRFLEIKTERLKKGEKPKANTPATYWYYLMGRPNIGTNLDFRGGFNPNAVTAPGGIDIRKRKFSGNIVVPIGDDRLIEQLSENGVCPTILDGGLLLVEGIRLADSEDLELNYSRISDNISKNN